MRLLSSWLRPAAALLSLVTACSPNTTAPVEADTLMHSSFEENIGWGNGEQPSLTTEKAHGGRVCDKVDAQVPFGYTFARTLGELGLPAGAQQLELSGWVLRTAAGSTASLAVQVDASRTDANKVYYVALPLAKEVTSFGEWQEVHLKVELPATAVGTNVLKVYLWNDKATSPTYLDDVALRRVSAK